MKMDASQTGSARRIDDELDNRQKEIAARMAASADGGVKLALPHLAATCGLSPAEVDILLIALAPELEPRYETLYAYLQNDVTRKRPSMDLCLNLICRTEQEKVQARRIFSPDATLLYFHLIELHEESYDRHPSQLRHFLRMDDTVTRFLLEEQPRQTSTGQLIPSETAINDLETSATSRTELKNLADALAHNGTDHAIVQLWGAGTAPLKEAAEALAHALKKDVLYSDLTRLDTDAAKLGSLIRDAAIWDNLLVVDCGLPEPREGERNKKTLAEEMLLARIVESNIAVVLLSADEPSGALGGSIHLWRVHVESPDFETRRESWRAALAGPLPDMAPDRLADLFSFSGKRVQQTVSLAQARAMLRNPADPNITSADVLAAGRDLTSPNMQRFAMSLEPRFGWDDLVLPPDEAKQLHSVAARFQFRSLVHRTGTSEQRCRVDSDLVFCLPVPPAQGKPWPRRCWRRIFHCACFRSTWRL